MSGFYYQEPTEAQRARGQRVSERFLYYGTGGLLDPKMPVEAYVFRTGSTRGIATRAGWSALGLRGFAVGAGVSMGGAVLALGILGAVFDPFDVNEGGLDEVIPYREAVSAFNRNTQGVWYPG